MLRAVSKASKGFLRNYCSNCHDEQRYNKFEAYMNVLAIASPVITCGVVHLLSFDIGLGGICPFAKDSPDDGTFDL